MAEDIPGMVLTDVLPENTPTFETFPTPAELARVTVNLHTYRYFERETGVQILSFLTDTDARQRLFDQDAMRTTMVAVTALANQHELSADPEPLPLRWTLQAVGSRLTLSNMGEYATAAFRGLGILAPAETEESATPRPTDGPQTTRLQRARGRPKKRRLSPLVGVGSASTGPSS